MLSNRQRKVDGVLECRPLGEEMKHVRRREVGRM
jgi:hypothetical protein